MARDAADGVVVAAGKVRSQLLGQGGRGAEAGRGERGSRNMLPRRSGQDGQFGLPARDKPGIDIAGGKVRIGCERGQERCVDGRPRYLRRGQRLAEGGERPQQLAGHAAEKLVQHRVGGHAQGPAGVEDRGIHIDAGHGLFQQLGGVVDLFGKIEGGTFVGDKLAYYVWKTTGTGLVLDGSMFYLSNIEKTGMPAYYRGWHPSSLTGAVLTGLNIPVQIGGVTVMPGDVVFLHEVVPGAADRSYGIAVAKLAGLPPAVLARAEEVLNALEQGDQSGRAVQLANDLPLFAQAPARVAKARGPSPVETALAAINPDDLSPRDALTALYALKKALAEKADD